MKSEMLLKHQTTTNPDFNFQFSLSHYTNSIVNPLLAQINETLRQTVASCTNILEGGGRTLIFSHICRLRPFLGVQNLLISIFLGIFRKIFYLGVYVYIKRVPPPLTHTHTNTGQTCTSKCTRVWCSSHLRMRGSRFSLFFAC